MRTCLARLLCACVLIAAGTGCTSYSSTPAPTDPASAAPWGPLWTGAHPPGANGHAVLGNNWQVQTLTAYTGISFVSPTLDALRIFDLLDRGFDPQDAISWMNGNGYPTSAAYYPGTNTIGLPTEYIAFISGRWDLVLRVGA